MRLFNFFIVTIFFVFFSTSCGVAQKSMEQFELQSEKEELLALTYKMVKENNITSETLSKIQFYAGDTIILERRIEGSGNASAKEGALVLRDGDSYEQIIIPAAIPGICLPDNVGAKTKKIVFGPDDKNFLVFGPGTDSLGTYVVYSENESDLVPYGGKKYSLVSGGQSLLVQPEEIGATVNRKFEVGRRLGSTPQAQAADQKKRKKKN